MKIIKPFYLLTFTQNLSGVFSRIWHHRFVGCADVNWWLLNEIHPNLPLEKEGAGQWVFGDVWALFQGWAANFASEACTSMAT
jgi:cytochrome b subunit of formate dehydrogenase